MAKEKIRTDIIAKAEEMTGIHYQEIIHSAYQGTKQTWDDIDRMVYLYEAGKRVPERVYKFASFLLGEWKKESAKK